ncbi:hypothetical protein UNDYM_5730 [Undibacterium sp. YM2]|nr:hypothetical protein UNDYM_5730 [Undibacterium sp. YM2]
MPKAGLFFAGSAVGPLVSDAVAEIVMEMAFTLEWKRPAVCEAGPSAPVP